MDDSIFHNEYLLPEGIKKKISKKYEKKINKYKIPNSKLKKIKISWYK